MTAISVLNARRYSADKLTDINYVNTVNEGCVALPFAIAGQFLN